MPEVSDTDLAARYQAGDREAGGLLLARHEGAIRFAARPFLRLPADRDDILQEARMGFLRGVIQFRADHGVKLNTYCHHAVRTACMTYMDDHTRTVRLPAYDRRRKTARTPAAGRIEDVQRAKRRLRSLDAPIGDSDICMVDTLRSEAPTPADEVETRESEAATSKLLHDAVGRLLPAQSNVIHMVWLTEAEPNMAEVARKCGVTRARIQQINSAALGNLRRALREVA